MTLFALGAVQDMIRLMRMKIIRLWTNLNTQLIVMNVDMISHIKPTYQLHFPQRDWRKQMNKQEAIEELEWNVVRTTDFDRAEYVVVFEKVKSIISQIHEPHKVVIPKFVAEYIERCKQSGWHLQKVLSRLDDDEKVGDWAYDENDDLIPEKVDMVAHAWLFGYQIEQEQLYTVEILNNGGTLILACINHAIKLVDGNKHLPGKFTKESIEYAGFDWALKWAKPAEVE
ncbi:DUF1642 domain-containing protein [Streptococcus suis]|uniref:DUF1642 domain-containing protein n=1 Tax=Streptococcus suis TaxID=1307 RepID=UPI000CF37890|nr:DUF1642 domain-containing protein [Streptococcus suis]